MIAVLKKSMTKLHGTYWSAKHAPQPNKTRYRDDKFRKAETTKVLLLFNARMQLCALIEITLARAMRNSSSHLVWVTINTQYLVSSSTSND